MHGVSDECYPLKIAAAKLGISVWTLRRRINVGAIDAVDLGVGTRRVLRVPATEIQRLLGGVTPKRGRNYAKAAREKKQWKMLIGS